MDFDFGHSFGLPFVKSPFARLIPTFAGSQYGTFDTPITFTGDFEVEVETAIPDASLGTPWLSLVDVLNTTRINQRGAMLANADGTTIAYVIGGTVLTATMAGGVTPYDGKIHKWVVKRVGTIGSIEIDGITQISGTVATAATDFDSIGADQSLANLFHGQLLSAKFTDAGTVVANYVFDSGSDLYQFPRGEGLGNELSGDPTCDIESYWDVVNASVTFDGDGADINYVGGVDGMLQRKASGEPLTIGDTVVCEVVLSSYTSGDITIFAGTTILGVVSSLGVTSFVGVVATDGRLQVNSSGFVGTISKLSYKKLPDLTCLLTNFATTDWNRYTQQRNIAHDAGVIGEAWVGDNEVPDGITANGRTIIAGTTITWQPSTGYPFIRFANDIKYLVEGDVVTLPSGQLEWNTGSTTSLLTNSLGLFKAIVDHGVSAADIYATPNGSGEPDIIADNISVRKLLEVA